MKTSTKIVVGVMLSVVVVGVATYLNRATTSNEGLVSEVERARHPVQTVQIAATELAETIQHTGALKAVRDVLITAEVAGKVRQLYRDLGDRCAQGQALLRLDAESYAIAVKQASAAYRQARAGLDQAEKDYGRIAELHRSSVATAQDLDRVRNARRSAQALAEQAKAARSLAQRNLRETIVRCPFDGVVAGRLVDVGQLVGPQTPLLRLVDNSKLELRLTVPAAELTRLQTGQPVELIDPSLPQQRYTGQVARLGVAGDPVTRTFPVKIVVPGGDEGPRPGQVVQATVRVALHRQAFAVPVAAIVHDGPQPVLFVVDEEQHARKTPVILGPTIVDRVIVEKGLSAGDEVIVVGHEGLTNGDAVVVANESPRAAASAAAPPLAE